MAKKTPLYEEHLKAGGKVVDYAGWFLPVEYKGLVPEHEAVRNRVGMFDVSHMGEITLLGKDARRFADHLTTNNIQTLDDGRVIYGFLCDESGGVVDDLLTYRASEEDIYLVVNAANVDKDHQWILDHKAGFDVEVKNVSDETGEVAVQGPDAEKTLQKLTDYDLSSIPFFAFRRNVMIAGVECMISRTGYTGEDGFEVYSTREGIVKVWNAVLEAGAEFGIEPCGLGCRDTLRFEAALPLYGHEISAEITPLEAGFKFFVDLNKEDFIGKKALSEQHAAGAPRKIIGLELLGKGIAREGMKVVKDGKEIGHVTTGYLSPTLKKAIANVLLEADEAVLDSEVKVLMRNREVDAKLISKRFLNKNTKSK
ncbi:MAG: glycine cleavage system aminomethyltransferase GcvT [Peptostreptococcaceae bacterium]|nr:glycine cleavage system aminomethyltransferase GcvT [Peptostreptococcaceae bacterium]